jgi:GGDEF domain-containing protein
MTCLVIDADHVEHINDTAGHQAGDLVLKRLRYEFGRTLRVGISPRALVGRSSS